MATTLLIHSHVHGNPTGAQLERAFRDHFKDAVVRLGIDEKRRMSFTLAISGPEKSDVEYAAELYLSPIQIGYELL